jgi:hypothetical protein
MTIRLRPTLAAAGADVVMAPAGADVLSAAMARLLATAKSEIDRHLNGNGTCTWCGRPWPCTTACLAEFTLGVFLRHG